MDTHEHHHREGSHAHLKVAVFTASDTRTPQSDESGRLIKEMLERAGHAVAHYQVLPDSPERIRQAATENLVTVDALIFTGGTGIAPRDSTIRSPATDAEQGIGGVRRVVSDAVVPGDWLGCDDEPGAGRH